MDAFSVLKQGAQHYLGTNPPTKARAFKCKNDARRNQATVAERRQQHKLYKWVRPNSWCTSAAFHARLGMDTLCRVVEFLIGSKSVDSIKAFALVNRECAAAVRAVLEKARRQLLQAQRALQEAGKRVVRNSTTPSNGMCQFRRLSEYTAFRGLMTEWGISQLRQSHIAHGRRTARFHNSKSMLAHMADACELCGKPMPKWSVYDSGEGPASIFTCTACTGRYRVEALVTIDCDEDDFCEGGAGFSDVDFVTVTLSACNRPLIQTATERARFMLSRKAQLRKRRLRGSHIQLNRQLVKHAVDMTECMRRFLRSIPRCRFQTERHQNLNHSRYSVHVTMWLDFPPELSDLATFTELMGINETSDLRHRADAVVAHKQHRSDERRDASRAFRKIHQEAKTARAAIIIAMEGVFEACEGMDTVLLVDLCHAAHAIEVRSLIHRNAFTTAAARKEALALTRSERAARLARIVTTAFVAVRLTRWPMVISQQFDMLLAIVRKTIVHVCNASKEVNTLGQQYVLEQVVRSLATAPIYIRRGSGTAPPPSATQHLQLHFRAIVNGKWVFATPIDVFVPDRRIRTFYHCAQFDVVDPIKKLTCIRQADLEQMQKMANPTAAELDPKATPCLGRMHSMWRTREAIYQLSNGEHWGGFVRRILEAAR
jgi:hypothetical protein